MRKAFKLIKSFKLLKSLRPSEKCLNALYVLTVLNFLSGFDDLNVF
jgi:hypothetical protein